MSNNNALSALGLPATQQIANALEFAVQSLRSDSSSVDLVSQRISDFGSSPMVTVGLRCFSACGPSVEVQVKYRGDSFLSPTPAACPPPVDVPNPMRVPARNPGPPVAPMQGIKDTERRTVHPHGVDGHQFSGDCAECRSELGAPADVSAMAAELRRQQDAVRDYEARQRASREPPMQGIKETERRTVRTRRLILSSDAIDEILAWALGVGFGALPGGPVENPEDSDIDVTVGQDGDQIFAAVKITHTS